MPFQFTRYLYVKEEVELSLFISLLNKKNDALFWAYELYYSGFLSDFRKLILNIYVLFYAPLNMAFGKYLINQLNQMKKCPECVSKIVMNMQSRSFVLDVFLLQKQVELFELEDETYDFQVWNAPLAHYLLSCDSSETILDQYSLTKFKPNMDLLVENGINKSVVLLSFVCHYFCAMNKREMGHNCYVMIQDQSVLDSFKTIDDYPSYRILPMAYKFEIDSHNWLTLFKLARDENGLRGCYMYHWPYFSLQTPFWMKRIKDYEIDEVRKQLWFPEDCGLEYNLEPDEQLVETQNKVLKEIKGEKTWTNFVEEFGSKNVYKIEEEYLAEFGKLMFTF